MRTCGCRPGWRAPHRAWCWTACLGRHLSAPADSKKQLSSMRLVTQPHRLWHTSQPHTRAVAKHGCQRSRSAWSAAQWPPAPPSCALPGHSQSGHATKHDLNPEPSTLSSHPQEALQLRLQGGVLRLRRRIPRTLARCAGRQQRWAREEALGRQRRPAQRAGARRRVLVLQPPC